jgi:hypothetical protein
MTDSGDVLIRPPLNVSLSRSASPECVTLHGRPPLNLYIPLHKRPPLNMYIYKPPLNLYIYKTASPESVYLQNGLP